MVVMADADLDLAVDGALFSGFGTSGQRCTSLGTVWVQGEVYDAFRDRFVAAVEDAVVGDPTQPVLYGPMISERYLDSHVRNLGLVAAAPPGARFDRHRAHHRRQPAQGVRRGPGPGRVRAPDDRRGRTAGRRACTTPRRSVRWWGWAGSTRWTRHWSWPTVTATGSRPSIYTRDPQSVWRFRAGISAGMVSVNNSTSGAEAHLPFGGNGRSGNGSRQSGVWVLDQFTRWQALNWDWSGHLQKAQMDVPEAAWDPGFRL